MDQELAKKIIQNTEKGYDLISQKFTQTRNHLWSDLEFIGSYCKKGDKVLDFGCGNGRLLDFLGKKGIEYVGVDISAKLLKEAQNQFRGPEIEFQKISGLDSLPLEDNSFNVVYAIAVFHHLPSREIRKKMAEELYRILRPEGTIVITVWNLWQNKYWRNIFFNWEEKILGRSFLDWNDCYINFQDNRGQVFSRYHHAFAKRELTELFLQAGFSIGKCDTI
ncbi:methyltransferase domain-containing protein, partial [Patescibacteria group bacterium]|nr:methyltransferase domain-containing protein [Patescibacteria group bacterium]